MKGLAEFPECAILFGALSFILLYGRERGNFGDKNVFLSPPSHRQVKRAKFFCLSHTHKHLLNSIFYFFLFYRTRQWIDETYTYTQVRNRVFAETFDLRSSRCCLLLARIAQAFERSTAQSTEHSPALACPDLGHEWINDLNIEYLLRFRNFLRNFQKIGRKICKYH